MKPHTYRFSVRIEIDIVEAQQVVARKLPSSGHGTYLLYSQERVSVQRKGFIKFMSLHKKKRQKKLR